MMLWNIIRDFFVRYIFGGLDSNGDMFTAMVGNKILIDDSGGIYGGSIGIDELGFLIPNTFDYGGGNNSSDLLYLSFGDYLSTTATIIVMVLLCVLLVKLAIWIFKLGANLIRLR